MSKKPKKKSGASIAPDPGGTGQTRSGLLPSAMLDPISGETIGRTSGGSAWGTEEFLASGRRMAGWDDEDEDVRRAEEVQRQEVRRQEEEKSRRNTPTASNLGADKPVLASSRGTTPVSGEHPLTLS